jgi:hypothetical protein
VYPEVEPAAALLASGPRTARDDQPVAPCPSIGDPLQRGVQRTD